MVWCRIRCLASGLLTDCCWFWCMHAFSQIMNLISSRVVGSTERNYKFVPVQCAGEPFCDSRTIRTFLQSQPTPLRPRCVCVWLPFRSYDELGVRVVIHYGHRLLWRTRARKKHSCGVARYNADAGICSVWARWTLAKPPASFSEIPLRTLWRIKMMERLFSETKGNLL